MPSIRNQLSCRSAALGGDLFLSLLVSSIVASAAAAGTALGAIGTGVTDPGYNAPETGKPPKPIKILISRRHGIYRTVPGPLCAESRANVNI